MADFGRILGNLRLNLINFGQRSSIRPNSTFEFELWESKQIRPSLPATYIWLFENIYACLQLGSGADAIKIFGLLV